MKMLLKRNLSKILLFTLILMASITFVACGGDESKGEDKTYNIILPQDENITITLDKN